MCYKIDYNPKNNDKYHYKGYFISKNNNKFWFDSSYELTRMKQLDMDDSILFWGRSKLKINYFGNDNKEHFYRPDFFIEYKNNEKVVEEVKGKLYKKDLIKLKAGIEWCEKNNLKFRVINYNDIYTNGVLEPIMEKYHNKFGEFYRISPLYPFIRTAQIIAERTTCLRRGVGCVIAPLNLYNFYSIGYNGSAPKQENGCKTLESGGKCGCIHAEINALKKINEMNIKMEDSILISTLAPCKNCAEEIVKYPIKKIIYLESYRDTAGIRFLKSKNIEVIKYSQLLLNSNKQLFITNR